MYGHFSKFAKFSRLSANPEMIVAARPDSPSKTLVFFGSSTWIERPLELTNRRWRHRRIGVSERNLNGVQNLLGERAVAELLTLKNKQEIRNITFPWIPS